MASRKPSANAKRIAEFKASSVDFGDLFDHEAMRIDELAEERKTALRNKACSSKNRYGSRSEAEDAAAQCASRGTRGLRVYRCKYCGGWHLTSKKA